jgi:hypothetical protein
LTPAQVVDSEILQRTKEIYNVDRQYAHADLILPSDLTDAEWAVLEPFFPAPLKVSPAGTGDRIM